MMHHKVVTLFFFLFGVCVCVFSYGLFTLALFDTFSSDNA